jgi:hypothetical protein
MPTAPESSRAEPHLFRAPDGELAITIHSPRLIATAVRGHFGPELTAAFVSAFDRWIAGGGDRLNAFHDWDAMTGYELQARIALTKWTVQHRRRFEAIHFLLTSPIVRAGVTIADFALGRFMTPHASRAAFDAEFRKKVATCGSPGTRP